MTEGVLPITPSVSFADSSLNEGAKHRSDIVGDDAHIVPKPYGKIVENFIGNVPEIEKYCIMPDHVHLLIRLENGDAGGCGHPPLPKRIESIVRSLKTLTTKEIGESIFQRSFYDHIIRNQKDYDEVWEYIDNNPRKWQMTHVPAKPTATP